MADGCVGKAVSTQSPSVQRLWSLDGGIKILERARSQEVLQPTLTAAESLRGGGSNHNVSITSEI